MPKVSLLLEDALAALLFVIGICLALLTLGIDEQPRTQRIYSQSFLKFPPAVPELNGRHPLDCDATVRGRSPGERPTERCYVRKSTRSSK